MPTGKPLSDSEVVQLRLKRSLLKELKDVTKGQSFTVAEAIRAAIVLGLELVKKDKGLIGIVESGMQPGETIIKRVFENWRIRSEMKEESPDDEFANLPSADSMGPTLEDLVGGKDEWYYIRKLHQRLRKLENDYRIVKAVNPGHGIVDYSLPPGIVDAVITVASECNVSQTDALWLLTATAHRLLVKKPDGKGCGPLTIYDVADLCDAVEKYAEQQSIEVSEAGQAIAQLATKQTKPKL